MELFQKAKEISSIQQELDGLQKYLVRLLSEKDVLAEDLKGYETPGYEQFKRVLAKEKVRIAMVRMTVDAGEICKHDRLQGQWNEVDLLERNKEKIESDISVANRKISDCTFKSEKLKKQLKLQAERK